MIVLTMAYVGLSDAKIPLPGGSAIRTWLDAREVTLFRPVAPEAVIRAEAADQRRHLVSWLLNLQMPDGLFSYRAGRSRESDSWTSAQLLAVLATTSEVDRRVTPKIIEAYEALFQSWVMRDDRGVSGFLFEPGRPPNGVISLWMVSALARALARLDLF